MNSTSRIPSGMDIPSPDNLSLESFTDEAAGNAFARDLGDVLNDIRDHLTKEELLCVSLFKNSKKPQHNHIFRVFFEKYLGKRLTSSAITHRKRRLLLVLRHVGALLRFKRDNNLDGLLKPLLTKKQYQVLLRYEKRDSVIDMAKQFDTTKAQISSMFSRIIVRLDDQRTPLIRRYLELLNNVLRFSRKRKIR